MRCREKQKGWHICLHFLWTQLPCLGFRHWNLLLSADHHREDSPTTSSWAVFILTSQLSRLTAKQDTVFFILLAGQRLSFMGAEQVFIRYKVVFDMVQRKIGTSWLHYLPATAHPRRSEQCQKNRGRRKGREEKKEIFHYYINNYKILIKRISGRSFLSLAICRARR